MLECSKKVWGPLTGNINILDNVKYVVLVDLSLLLSVQNMIYGALQAFMIRALRARELPVYIIIIIIILPFTLINFHKNT